MKRFALHAALLMLLASSACQAEEGSFCKSMCASERQECRSEAVDASERDAAAPLRFEDKNPHAQAAMRREGRPEEVRAAEKASFQRAKRERTGSCETRFQQCTRSCGPAPQAR